MEHPRQHGQVSVCASRQRAVSWSRSSRRVSECQKILVIEESDIESRLAEFNSDPLLIPGSKLKFDRHLRPRDSKTGRDSVTGELAVTHR